MRRLAVLGGLGALIWFVYSRLRKAVAQPAAPEPFAGVAPAPSTAVATDDRPPPGEPKRASEADPTDREVESRLDPQLGYDRKLEEEEAARSDAARRLRREFAGDDEATPADDS